MVARSPILSRGESYEEWLLEKSADDGQIYRSVTVAIGRCDLRGMLLVSPEAIDSYRLTSR